MVDFGVPLELFETATPEPTGTQVLFHVTAAGLSASDMYIVGRQLRPWLRSRACRLKDRGISVPLTLGHETAGEVVAAGPDARGVRPGDVRLVYPWIGSVYARFACGATRTSAPSPASLGSTATAGTRTASPFRILNTCSILRASIPLCGSVRLLGVTTYSALAKLKDVIVAEPMVVWGWWTGLDVPFDPLGAGR